jgi:group I intron endonuclease
MEMIFERPIKLIVSEIDKKEYYGIIYRAVNKINGKIYIGQTINTLKQRVYQHKSEAKLRNSNIKFLNAILKYGIDGFVWEIIEYANTIEQLDKLEKYYINKYNTVEDGYNSKSGGHGIHNCGGKSNGMFGKKHTEDTKRLIGSANGGTNSYWFGKRHSEQTKKKMSLSQTGSKNHMYGRLGKDNPSYGKVLSKTTKEKIGKSVSFSWLVTFPNGDSKIIKNLRKFCRLHNILYDNGLLYVAAGKYKQYKGFKCKKIYEEVINIYDNLF